MTTSVIQNQKKWQNPVTKTVIPFPLHWYDERFYTNETVSS